MREAGWEKQGTALASVTFVDVRWQWLTLVAAQVVLSLVFLLSVIIYTTRLGVNVVKSSNMAELFAMSAPDWNNTNDSRADGVVYEGISTKVGKDVEAILRKGSEGWRLEVTGKEPGI